MTHHDLLVKLGGAALVAQSLGLPTKRVYNWGRPLRGIPGAYWPGIIRLAEKKKLLIGSLRDVQPNPLEKPPRALAPATLRRQERRAAAVGSLPQN